MKASIKRFLPGWLPFRRHLKSVAFYCANLARDVRKEAYYCNALSGNSDYNICINSDMTVSCNCVDIDGSGHIGDLSSNTLEEIFAGATADRFRRSLSRGRIPIRRCLECRELIKTPRKGARRYVTAYATPKRGIMVENTVLCNLRCLNCSRKAILATRKKHRMSLADIENVAKNVRSNNIEVINYFNLGEPFMSETIHEEIATLKKYNPGTAIYVSTNGLLINREEKFAAALLTDYLYVSLDGATNESVNRYQAGGNFEVSYRNMKELVRRRNSRGWEKPVIDWKYVVFCWNDSEAEIERAVELARAAGVDILSFWPGSGAPAQISRRFAEDDYFKTLGSESWKGREIDFRK